jgi:glycerol-3-phosphate acyltransferase PlsY
LAATGFVLLAYLIGSIPFAVVTSRVFRLPDPRTYGSKNPGATNVLRAGSKAAAAATLFGDAAKGYVAVALTSRYAPQFGAGEVTVAASAAAVFLGHVYPLFLEFRGGKGVATALGVSLALSLWLGVILGAVWLAVAAATRISSLAALTAATCAPFLGVWLLGLTASSAAVLAMALLLVFRHRANIRSLMAGTEGRIGGPRSP